MPLSDSEVRSLEAGDKRKVVSAGDSLYIVVYPAGRGGGKYLVGRMRHPPGSGAKQVEVQIGPYGKGADKWSLKKARDEWDRIRAWSKDTGNDPRELKKSHKREAEKKFQGPTFQHLVDAYLAWGETKQPKPMKPRTVQDYRNKLVNQMFRAAGSGGAACPSGSQYKGSGFCKANTLVSSSSGLVAAAERLAPVDLSTKAMASVEPTEVSVASSRSKKVPAYI